MRIPLSFCVPPIVRICLFVLSLCAAECRSLEQQQQQQQQSQQYERAALDDSENNQGDDYVASDEAQDTTVLVTTLIIYGPALVILLILFSIVRTRYPTIYNVRSVVDRLYNPLAVANGGGAGGGKAGCFGWIWHVWHISDDSLLEHCSLDAVCVLRIVRFGRNLAMVSVFCSWFLIPVYTTSPTLESEEETPGTNITSSSSNSNGTVGWTKTTTTYLPPDSYRYTATVLAAYIVFGYFMVSLLKELKWFTEKHESYLAKQENPTAQSYTVYVSGIPPEYRSNTALAAFFCQILSRDSVHQASMVLNMPKLNAATVRQTNLKLQLERAQALAANDERKGGPEIVTATATTKTTGPSLSTDNTDSNNKKNDNKLLLLLAKPVDYCIEQLELETQNVAYWRSVVDAKLEDELVATPSKIQSDAATANNSSGRDSTNTNGSTASTFVTATQSVCAATIAVGSFKNTFTSQKNATSHGDHPTNKSSCADHRSSKSPAQIALNDTDEIVDLQPSSPSVFSIHEREIETTQQDILRSESIILSDTNNEVTQESIAQDFSAVIGQEIQQSCFANLPNVGLGDAASKVAKTVVGLIESDDEKNEGKPMDVGFVTFTKLSAVSVALQVVHSTVPYQMEVAQAPSPEELLWGNVGLSQQRIQSGKLLAIALTTALCIFWTVPVTLLISLTEVNALKKDSRFLQEWVDAAPWLENVLNQVAPLLISFLNQVLLPQILRCISRLEGALGASQLEAALFTKLSAFHIFQTFFVASIAGSITSVFSQIDSFSDILKHLAQTLPPQAIFFIQVILINTTIGLGCEMLRTTALMQGFCRDRVGPRATERERGLPFIGLRPFSNPRNFLYPHVLASQSLLFMVLFTFVFLSPLISYALLFSFTAFEIGYRHQFIYVYPSTPDSGGRMFMTFVNILLICTLIAELMLMTVMVLAQTRVEFALMIPLIVATLLFNVYIRQKHFYVTHFLSSKSCVELDNQNEYHRKHDNDFLSNKYVQPALLPAFDRVDLNTFFLGLVHYDSKNKKVDADV